MISGKVFIRLVKLAEVVQKLHAPARYELNELLRELKSGRPAAEQQWLREKIKELRANSIRFEKIASNKQISRKAMEEAFNMIRRNALALIHAEKVIDPKYQQVALHFIEVNLKSLKEWGAHWDKLASQGVNRIQDTTAIDNFVTKNYNNFVSYLKDCKKNLEYYVQNGNPQNAAWSNALKNCEQALQILGE